MGKRRPGFTKEDIHDGDVDKGESESNEGGIASPLFDERISKRGIDLSPPGMV